MIFTFSYYTQLKRECKDQTEQNHTKAICIVLDLLLALCVYSMIHNPKM